MRRFNVLIATLIVAGVVFSAQSVQAQTAERCFIQTGFCIKGAIREYWERNGGLPVFGYPITNVATETNAEGFTGPTQYFERDRLEDQGARGVLAGRLGVQKLAREGRPWESLPKVSGAAPGCLFFRETGHSLCQPFRAYWEANGGLARFGYPISEPSRQTNPDGYTGTMQFFERRRMEAHPQNQPPFDVLLGLLGKELLGTPPPPTGGGPTPPPPSGQCEGIQSAYFVNRTPQNGCLRVGQSIAFEVFGVSPNIEIGYRITRGNENGPAVGGTQTLRTNSQGRVTVTVNTANYGGTQLPAGNYTFVVIDQSAPYRPVNAPFRIVQ